MLSFRNITVVAFGLLATVQAQTNYTIVPDSVPIATRDGWCNSQISTCPYLCTQLPGGSLTTSDNTCDPDNLTYSCVCGTGGIPNAANYSLTLPYFVCQQWQQNCVAACADNICQAACTADHPCGAQNPTRINITSTTSSTQGATATGARSTASTTSSGGQVFNGIASTPTAAAQGTSGAVAMADFGRGYGFFGLVGGLLAGFMMLM